MAIKQQVHRASRGPVDLIIDSTGWNVCEQGEWHSPKHGEKKRKRWALVPFDVICPPEPDLWTLPSEKVMILSRGTSFAAEDQYDIDPYALYRLWV